MSQLFGRLPQKDLISVAQLGAPEIQRIFTVAAELKSKRAELDRVLPGRRLAMIFEKDSLRTRFTFDIGMQDLGGGTVFLDHRDARLGSRESLKDMARNLERWVHAIVARTFKHRAIEELAANCRIPVVNGLSDLMHPCQALSDFFTLTEKWGDVRGRRLCYVGDGNNTCHSLLHTAALLGTHMTVCSPEGYEPNSKIVNEAMNTARGTGAEITILDDPDEAADGADAIYTDVWASMGQEGEAAHRQQAFAGFQVNARLLQQAPREALFMHDLPAKRGLEVTDEVIDSRQSIVFQQAENRMHLASGLFAWLLGK